MFEVRNETEIWYKAKEMLDWIHYGSAVVAEPIEKEKFAVKRFDLEKGEYLLYTDCKTYFYNGVEYSVTDGCFTVPKPKEEPAVYQPNDAELAIMEMQADMYEQQEQSNLTLMESLADFYETMIGGNEE